MGNADPIEVEVVYAETARQHVVAVRVSSGASVAEVIRQSGILDDCPQIDLARAQLGIFARRVDADTRVRAGDRIEIYRTLRADPKSVRRAHGKRRKP